MGYSPFDYQQQQQEYARHAATLRSYTTPTVIVMILYLILWLPGNIANVVYLGNANADKRLTGMELQGRGCLIALLVVFGALPFLACTGFFGLTVLAGILGTASSTR